MSSPSGGSYPNPASPGNSLAPGSNIGNPAIAPANPAPGAMAPSTNGTGYSGQNGVAPSTTGNPQANSPAIPGAVSPSNPDAASRPQTPNIGGAPIIMNNPR